MKKNLLLTIALVMFAWAGMMAESFTFDFSTMYSNQQNVVAETPESTDGQIKLVFAKNDASTNPTYYDSGESVRLYQAGSGGVKGGSITITAPGGATITDVTVTTEPRGEAFFRYNAGSGEIDFSTLNVVGLSASSFECYTVGTASDERVYVKTITVTYTGGGEVLSAPVLSEVMPVSGSIYSLNEEFEVSATITTEDVDGIDSVVLAYGSTSSDLADTMTMIFDGDSSYSVKMEIGDAGSHYGQIIAYAGNGEMNMSSTIEVIGELYNEFDMATAYYQIIVDTVIARGKNTLTYNETVSENYYGASAKYDNFDAAADGSYDTLMFESSDAAIVEALSTILLPAIRLTAVVSDTFVISYVLYKGATDEDSMTFVCTSVSPLVFEYVGDVSTSLQTTEVLNVVLYPNPASSSIQLTKAVDAVQFISLSGRILLSRENVSAHSSIDVSSLDTGVYFVKVNAGGKTAVSKFIKE